MAEPALATGPAPDRRNLDQWLGEVERAASQQKADRRGGGGIEALRAEVQRSLVTNENDVGRAPNSLWRELLKPSRLALVAVALVAGGVAAYFATQSNAPAPAPAPVVEAQVAPPPPPPAPAQEILVAKRAIGLGTRLSSANIEWKPWPTDAMRDDYIVKADRPEAEKQMASAIARFEFFPGEPIRMQKLAVPGDGYVSAVLAPGERAVSIHVTAGEAAGGFVQPNDHVDVLLNQSADGTRVVETLLRNVRVLAIGRRVGDVGTTSKDDEATSDDEKADSSKADGSKPKPFGGDVIATLVLDSAQAEMITAADRTGALTLVLRSISDFAPTGEDNAEATANQRIKLTSPFWVTGSTKVDSAE